MKTIVQILLILTVPLFAQQVPTPALIPWPQEVLYKSGNLVSPKNMKLVTGNDQKALKPLIETFIKDLDELGYEATYDKQHVHVSEGRIFLNLVHDTVLEAEEYVLNVDDGITITANSANGLFWATRTVLQLISGGPGSVVPRMDIKDKPMFEYRGLMVDNARHHHALEFHLETIKRLSSYKMNRYHIHFSDHQSYTLPSDKFPELPTKGQHLSKQDVRILMEQASRYHVEIIPEIDVPGHARALTEGIPELKCTGVKGSRGKICIGKESTFEILQSLFTEVMEMFPGDYWHLGADEVHYANLDDVKCKACKARMQEKKYTTGLELYHSFINEMYTFVKEKKRTMFVWEGFEPNAKPEVNKEIIVCPFDVKHEGKMPADYMNNGYILLNTSWAPLYVADKIYMTTPEMIARWTPFMFGAGRSPTPLAYWHKFDPTSLVIGAQICSWNNEAKAEEGLLFGTGAGFSNYGRPAPRLQIVAERLWSGTSTGYTGLLQRVGSAYWGD